MGDNLGILGGALAFIGGLICHHSYKGPISQLMGPLIPIFINIGNLNCTPKMKYK